MAIAMEVSLLRCVGVRYRFLSWLPMGIASHASRLYGSNRGQPAWGTVQQQVYPDRSGTKHGIIHTVAESGRHARSGTIHSFLKFIYHFMFSS